MSALSDDEYHYSDIEEDEEDHQHLYREQGDDDDEEEYQYSDDNASVTSDPDMHSSNSTSASTGNGVHKSRSPHTEGGNSSSRLSPLGASGSAAKKKRMSPGAMHNHKQAEEYRVIDEQELFLEQRALIHEIAQVLEISPSVAAIMLRHFGWNKEKLYEGYYSDPAKAQEDAGVAFANTPAPRLREGELVSCFLFAKGIAWMRCKWNAHMLYFLLCVALRQVDCMICCDSYPANEVFGMGCGHLYCLVSTHTFCVSRWCSFYCKDG